LIGGGTAVTGNVTSLLEILLGSATMRSLI
jgi:hypothetical protein